MKKSILIIPLVVILLLLAGCKYFPGGSPIPAPADEALGVDAPAKKQEIKPLVTKKSADDVISQVVTAEKKEVLVNVTNVTNVTEVKLNLTGSLALQSDLTLCPHLNTTFQCDRYDVRRCEIKQIVGKEDYYPDLMNCRAGKKEKGEDPSKRYCLIQECSPLQKGNLVYAYGGPLAFAEYDYKEDKSGGSLMTYYTLLRCGEMDKQFNSSFDCTVYKAELDELWP